MKKLLLFLTALSIYQFSQAQTARQQSDPNSGHFDVIKNTSKGQERINVNYVLSSYPFTNSLTLNMNTPDPMGLSVKIVNAEGLTMMNWLPAQISHSYEKQFDISGLKAGKYKIEVYGDDGKKVYSINFEKQASTLNNNNTGTTK